MTPSDPGFPYTIPFEVPADPAAAHLQHAPGRVAMARSSAKDSGSSQFYVSLGDNPTLNGEYAVFGQVEYGLETAERIAAVETGGMDRPREPVRIEWARLRPR